MRVDSGSVMAAERSKIVRADADPTNSSYQPIRKQNSLMLKNISLSSIVPSKTNPRGKEFSGPAFDELVASIKEKGVLMPILVRPLSPEKGEIVYEIVAGHRRYAAAKAAGLDQIPAQVQDMTDIEAREAQIVENLQRQDIHPLEEGEAYRMLIEKSRPKYETADIALKVGMSESYVRGRFALTNLTEKVAAAFRSDKIKIGHAMLIARIDDEKVQVEAMKRVTDYDDDVNDLREWIQEKTFKALMGKPWAKNAKIAEMVGDSKINKGPSLFGDDTAGIDPVAFAQKMAAFIEIKRREYQGKGIVLLMISTDWGTPGKGVLARDQYRILTGAEAKDEKAKPAIIVEGDEMGKIVKITTEKEEIRGTSVYKPTPEEKAARTKELAKAKEKKAAMNAEFQEAIASIKFPLKPKQLDALMDFAFHRCGYSYQQPACVLLELEPVMKKEKINWGEKEGQTKMVRDYELTLKKFAEDNGDLGKLKVIFALLMPHPSEGYEGDFRKAAKKL